MKISATITDGEFEQIKYYIDCKDWANPIQDEFIFYEPTQRFLLILALFNIAIYEVNK
jgi:hypothetical protein